MTLREWLCSNAKIHSYQIREMAHRLGMDEFVDYVSPYDNVAQALGDQANPKCEMIIRMFQEKFGLDEEF